MADTEKKEGDARNESIVIKDCPAISE